MVIAFLTPSMNGGGAERVISSLSNFYVNSDKVYILELGNDESAYSLDDSVSLVKLNVARKSSNLIETFSNFQRYKKKIQEITRRIKADVIVAFTVRLAVIAKQAVGNSVTVIGSERGNPFIVRKSLVDKYIRIMSTIIDGCIFQTVGASTYYPKSLRIKGIVIPNGVFLNVPNKIIKYEERDNVIVVTGNLRKLKRHDLIIEAFAKFSFFHPEFLLHIYGDGEVYDEILENIKSRGLEDKIILKGYYDNLAEILTKSKIFVLASDHEGMPNGLIEAMACGCACIATNCDFGPGELIQNGKNGLLVETGNADAIYKAMISIVDNNDNAVRLAENASMIKESHSLQLIAERYHGYIDNVIQKRRR